MQDVPASARPAGTLMRDAGRADCRPSDAGCGWIVDIEARRVHCSRPGADDAELVTGQLTWHPAGASRPLLIDLPALFDAIPAVFREA